MRRFVLAALVVSVANVSLAQNMTIRGTVRGLNGAPLDRLQDFTVEAFGEGQLIASGTVTPAAPFVYTIQIDANAVNANDVRILLAFRATGRDNVDLDKIVGRTTVVRNNVVVAVNGNQTIDIVMPIAETCPQPDCCPWLLSPGCGQVSGKCGNKWSAAGRSDATDRGMRTSSRHDGPTAIGAGRYVIVVTPSADIMVKHEVIASVKKAVVLPVRRIENGWVWTSTIIDNREVKGWIWGGDLEGVDAVVQLEPVDGGGKLPAVVAGTK